MLSNRKRISQSNFACMPTPIGKGYLGAAYNPKDGGGFRMLLREIALCGYRGVYTNNWPRVSGASRKPPVLHSFFQSAHTNCYLCTSMNDLHFMTSRHSPSATVPHVMEQRIAVLAVPLASEINAFKHTSVARRIHAWYVHVSNRELCFN